MGKLHSKRTTLKTSEDGETTLKMSVDKTTLETSEVLGIKRAA